MFRHTIATAALGLLASGTALADNDILKLGRYQPAASGFAGGTASTDDDTVLTHGKHRYYGGHRGYSSWSIGIGYGGYYGRPYGYGGFYGRSYGYGGYYGRPYYGYGGYYGRPYGYGGYYGRSYGYSYGGYGYGYRGLYGWPGYYGSGLAFSYYKPGFAISVYSAPRSYYGLGYPAYGFGVGAYFPIAGTTASTVTLDLPARPAVPLETDLDGVLRYDGGPTNPVPLPAPDRLEPPQRIAPARDADSVPISVKKPQFRYPAYGEK